MDKPLTERLKQMSMEDKSVDFPECFFGVKGYNHVHDNICAMSGFGIVISLLSIVACFFWLENNVWVWLLGVLGLFLITTLGNVLHIRWFYIPIMIVFGFCTFVWAFAVVGKIGLDLCWLNQPLLHRYIGAHIDRTFPPLTTDERIQLLITVIMEFLLLLPVRFFGNVMSVLYKGFLYLEQTKKQKNTVLPVRIDPFLLSAETRSDISD